MPSLAGAALSALRVLAVVALAACAGTSRPVASSRGPDAAPARPAAGSGNAASAPSAPSSLRGKGGFYMDDGPMDPGLVNLDAVPDATPAVEPLHRFANRPYNVFGNDYLPQLSIDDPFEQTGIGSWYGRKFHGQRTSSGEIYDMFAMTAAHPTLPIPSYARVTNTANGKSVVVRVNDRGPFLHSRVIDLSYVAAHRLGYVQQGSAEVRVEKLTPVHIARVKDGRPIPAGQVASASAATVPAAGAAGAMASGVAAPVAPLASSSPVVSAAPAVSVAAAAPVPAQNAEVPAQAVSSDSRMPLSGSFFLQLGAFSVEDNARAFLSRLSLEFSDHLPNLQVVRREPLFRLLAGPYRSREEAQLASRRLKDTASIAAVVVTP